MDRRIFGLETEYGVACTSGGTRRLTPDEVARYLFRRVVTWGRSSNVFLRNGSRIYLDVARNAGATRFQTFRRIALPSALPSIFTGLKLAAGSSYIIIAAAEFLGARSGVGFFIWASWQTFAVSRMFVGIVVISVMGYLTILALQALERRFVPWAKH